MLNLVRDLRQITLCLNFRAKILSISKSKKDSFFGHAAPFAINHGHMQNESLTNRCFDHVFDLFLPDLVDRCLETPIGRLKNLPGVYDFPLRRQESVSDWGVVWRSHCEVIRAASRKISHKCSSLGVGFVPIFPRFIAVRAKIFHFLEKGQACCPFSIGFDVSRNLAEMCLACCGLLGGVGVWR
jgi:hypothetical protein